jgi:hypothetical protein
LLDEEVILTTALHSKVAAIIRKKSPSGFLVNFYIFPRQNGIRVLQVPRKRTYVGYPTKAVLQTTYVSVVLEDRLQGLAYLIDKDDILLGQKAFCIGMSNCFFLCK